MSVLKNSTHRNALAITSIIGIIGLLFYLWPARDRQPHTFEVLAIETIVILVVEILYLFKNFNR